MGDDNDDDDVEVTERLHEIFEDVEDVAAPASMERVLKLVEEIRTGDNAYMEVLKLKLKDVSIDWEQPWYQDTTSLTRKPEMVEHGEPYETGPFTHDELKLFRKNWRKFVRKYDVPDTPIKLARWKNIKKSRNVKISPEEFVRSIIIAHLARYLKRSSYQVYRLFQQTYGYPVKLRTYTETEEKILEIVFHHRPKNQVPILSAVLGREPRAIYYKLDQYYNGENKKKRVKWSLKLATKFLNTLMAKSGCSLEELKNKQFHQSVWLKVEEVMKHQYKYLQEYWYGKLHVQLFGNCNIDKKSFRKIICKKLQESPYKVWTDIRWKKLVLDFPSGFTHTYLHNTTRHIFDKYADYLTTPLQDLLPKIKKEKEGRKSNKLKCVQLNNKSKLVYVNYDVKLKDLMRRG